ncbi:MAG TPA: hypothetical protein PLO59_06160, partial [Bacteroidia bacterium]|nr:hypothetical protein [Bacteroidia bacterium]
HVNAQYEKQGALNLQQFFTFKDVTQHCITQTDWIRQKLIKAKLTLENGKIPAIDIGEHCKLPYPCDFTNTCHRHVSKPLSLVVPTDFNLEPTAKQMVLCMLSTKPAIPVYDGCKPYQLIPFAFATKSTSSRFVHQFTGNNYENPTNLFIEKLYNVLADADVIWVDEILVATQLFNFFNQMSYADQNWELITEKLAGIDTFFTSYNYFDINLAAQQIQVTVPINTKVPHAIAATEIYMTMQQSQDLFSAAEQAELIQQYLSDQLQLLSKMANTLGRFTNTNYV